jgi:hypothetical protein
MEILFICCIAAGMATVFGYRLYARAQRVRRLRERIESFPWQAIATAREGRAAVQGVARAGELLRAPLSGREVIGFRVKVEHQDSSNRNARWLTLVDISEVNAFQVQDSTGTAWVEPSFSSLILALESQGRNGMFSSAPPELEQLLNKHGETTRGWIFEKALRWSEYLLEPGERVYVGGHARREIDHALATAGYRDTPTRLVINSPDDGPMIISDSLRRDLIESLGMSSDLPNSSD